MENLIALPNKYLLVNSLYKYGCGACGRKDKNKWFSICDACKSGAADDGEVKELADGLRKDIDNRLDDDYPEINEDEWKCDCGLSFKDINEFRSHCKDEHPNTDISLKRSKIQHGEAGKKGRRLKGVPERSLSS